jgi:hypothetical protein
MDNVVIAMCRILRDTPFLRNAADVRVPEEGEARLEGRGCPTAFLNKNLASITCCAAGGMAGTFVPAPNKA